MLTLVSLIVMAWSLFDTAILTISPASTTATTSRSTTLCFTSSLLLILLQDQVSNLWLSFLNSSSLWLLFLYCWLRRIWRVPCWLRHLHSSHSTRSALVRYVCHSSFLVLTLLTRWSRQYFLWYMVFLPFYLPTSSLVRQPKLGFSALALWIIGQVRADLFLPTISPS